MTHQFGGRRSTEAWSSPHDRARARAGGADDRAARARGIRLARRAPRRLRGLPRDRCRVPQRSRVPPGDAGDPAAPRPVGADLGGTRHGAGTLRWRPTVAARTPADHRDRRAVPERALGADRGSRLDRRGDGRRIPARQHAHRHRAGQHTGRRTRQHTDRHQEPRTDRHPRAQERRRVGQHEHGRLDRRRIRRRSTACARPTLRRVACRSTATRARSRR